MGEPGGNRAARENTSSATSGDVSVESAAPQPSGPPAGRFTSAGPIPPVALDAHDPRPSASERAFGDVSPRSAAQRQSDDVARIEYVFDTTQTAANGLLGELIPAYIAARDQRDVQAVAELGGRIIAAFGIVHGGKDALGDLQKKVGRKSVAGTSVDQDLAEASALQKIDAKAPVLQVLLPTLDQTVATTLTPHVFRGHEVMGQAVSVSVAEGSPASKTAKLTGELQRTLGMLVLVEDLQASLLHSKQGLERKNLEGARSKVAAWASRPLDLAFLRSCLGQLWDVLDSTATGPMDVKPSAMLANATKQAAHTGWLGDVGRFDIDVATSHLRIGGRQMAELVLADLYTCDPDTRAQSLMQIRERGLLEALCGAVGWADIKQLHDSLGAGFGDLKTDLQRYFLGKGKYGPSLDSEWENHDSSLHSLVGRLGTAGKVLNFGLDVGTFGFNSSYGKAIDDRSEGLTSESEASRAKMHAAGKTAVVAAVAMLTGGLADKAVRGGAATVSTIRGIAAGAAGGSVGSVAALGTSDVYGNYVSGDQQGFSSPEDYVKAALMGGAIGGVIGGVTQGLSNRVAERYLPETGTSEGQMYKVSSNGLRNEEPLTPDQIKEAVTYARELGVPDDVINVTEHGNTSWGELFGTERLNIGTDVEPATNPRIAARSANSRVSAKGAIAHEVVGHRASALAGRTQESLVLEEAQASIRAARFAPGLTSIERLTLIRDAVERLQKAGLRVADVRDKLWIQEEQP